MGYSLMVKIVRASEVRERKRMRIMFVLSIVIIIVGGISLYEAMDFELARILATPPHTVTNVTRSPTNSNVVPVAKITTQVSDSGADVYVKSINREVSWNNTSLTVTWDSGTSSWSYSYAVGYNYQDGGYNLTESGKAPVGGYAIIGNPLTGGSTNCMTNGSGIFITSVPGISQFSINDISTNTVIASWTAS